MTKVELLKVGGKLYVVSEGDVDVFDMDEYRLPYGLEALLERLLDVRPIE